MDPIASLATSAIAIISPYLAKAGEEIAEEVGKVAANKIGMLYNALRTNFKNSPPASGALSYLEANPNDKDAQGALRIQLAEQMKTDQSFADTIRKIIDEIDQDKELQTFITKVYGGEVGQIINANHIDSISYTKDSKPKRKSRST